MIISTSDRVKLFKIYNWIIDEYNKFYENLDISKVDRKYISDACLNIFIFMRNDEKFKQLNVIWNTLEFVFHLFLNN